MKRNLTIFVLLLPLLLGVPLLGVVVAGGDLSLYLEFPPLTRYVTHAPFSWPVFVGIALFTLLCIAPFVGRIIRANRDRAPGPKGARTYPWWGWLGLALTAVAWLLAWTRFAWLEPLQAFTFTPLWFGYILSVNGLSYRRTGRCLLVDRRGYYLALFPVSAVFWWFFEYLNRFVQNWYYVGITGFTAWEYFIFATLAFSTVLPAVSATREWLASFPGLSRGLDQVVPFRVGRPRTLAWAVLLVAVLGLGGVGVWPDILFPLVWIAPVLIIVSLQVIHGEQSLCSGIARGDWQTIWVWALAALACGLFWEMWNYYSLAKWRYALAYVDRFRIFEMPLLGYAGYLPFGLECAAVAGLVDRLTGGNNMRRGKG